MLEEKKLWPTIYITFESEAEIFWENRLPLAI
jgi:hypothetical protein